MKKLFLFLVALILINFSLKSQVFFDSVSVIPSEICIGDSVFLSAYGGNAQVLM